MEGEKNGKTTTTKTFKKLNFILNRLGRGPFSSHRRGIRYFAFLLKLNDRRSAGFLAFIRPLVQWIIQQLSFASILSPWNARFSLLLVLGKYSYALGQLTRSPLLPADFTRQSIAHARKSKLKGSKYIVITRNPTFTPPLIYVCTYVCLCLRMSVAVYVCTVFLS